ncbi:Hemicentin-1 [Manis pentadactyla]|nr:Hemicentin-1 [Manis pentadactyla]
METPTDFDCRTTRLPVPSWGTVLELGEEKGSLGFQKGKAWLAASGGAFGNGGDNLWGDIWGWGLPELSMPTKSPRRYFSPSSCPGKSSLPGTRPFVLSCQAFTLRKCYLTCKAILCGGFVRFFL